MPQDMEELVFTKDRYETPATKIALLARPFPSLWFYCKFMGVVWRYSRVAKRGELDLEAWRMSSLAVIRAMERVGVQISVEGIDHLRRLDEPAVFVGNHMSMLETTLLPGLLLSFLDVTFVVKQSLVEYPVFGHIMRACDPVTVTRTDPRQDMKAVLEGGAARLAAGRSVVVFPQTTRTPTFDPAHFNTIGVKLARRAGAPLVPLALKTDAWENGKVIKDLGRIDRSKRAHFEFGEAMHVHGRGAEEHQVVVEFIQERLRSWGGEVAGASE